MARGTTIQLDRDQSGQRTFDFNTDGLAHIGLLPDFLADLEVLGIPLEDLEAVFRSAQGFIDTWERAIHASQRLKGPLDAPWMEESSQVASLALADDRIAVLNTAGTLFVKEGPLDAPRTEESSDLQAFALEGDRIGVLKRDGTLFVKEGPTGRALDRGELGPASLRAGG